MGEPAGGIGFDFHKNNNKGEEKEMSSQQPQQPQRSTLRFPGYKVVGDSPLQVRLRVSPTRLNRVSFLHEDFVKPFIRFGIFFGTLLSVVIGFDVPLSLPTTLVWVIWQTIWFATPLMRLKQTLQKRDKEEEEAEEDEDRDEAGKQENGNVESEQDGVHRAVHVFLAFASFALVNVTYDDPTYHSLLTGGGLFLPLWYLGALASLGFAVWSKWVLGDEWTGVPQVCDDQKLITTGPYAITRHPIYTGLIGMMVCCAIYNGTWVSYFAATLGSLVYVYKTIQEETMLKAHFGHKFIAYQQTTPMLIPYCC